MEDLKVILSDAMSKLRKDPNPAIVDWLANQLGDYYDNAIERGDLQSFVATCRQHPIRELISEDPYSRRAQDKPRGYAGDAVMLDYIYRPNSVELRGAARAIHEATTSLPNGRSILWRRDYLAGLLVARVSDLINPRVLSIAAGHMRELDRVRQLTLATDMRITALDQDAESIAQVLQDYPEFTINGLVGSFTSLIKGRMKGLKFDLIYSAGLFDYLQDDLARALIRSMYAHLAPKGTMSIGNFSSDSHGRGFMAGLMEWHLVYRDEIDLSRLLAETCPKARYRVFRDGPGNVVYGEVYAD